MGGSRSGITGVWSGLSLVLAVLIFGGGTVATILLGHEVPPTLWAIDGALANALVSNTAFFTQANMHAAALFRLSEMAAMSRQTTTGAGEPQGTGRPT